jgi:hypothetical protein
VPEVRGKGSAGEGQAMTQQLAWRASLVVILLIASVGTASAECAWVLWTKINALEWETRGGYDTRADCERERGKSVEGALQGTGGSQFVVVNAAWPTRSTRSGRRRSRLAAMSLLRRAGRRRRRAGRLDRVRGRGQHGPSS